MKSYFIFLGRNKLYAFITIFGFAASLMFVILMAIYTTDQFTVDNFHANKDRIYRLQYDGDENGNVPPVLGEDLKNRYPEIESYTRVRSSNEMVKNPDGERIFAQTLVVDSVFFEMFDFPFVEGSAKNAMVGQDMVVISQNFARKMFGSASALGKTIERVQTYATVKEFVVSGVVKDFKNTVFDQCDIIGRVDGLYKGMWEGWLAGYNSCNYSLFVMTHPQANIRAREADVTKYFKDDLKFWLFKDGFHKTVNFKPLTELYFSPMWAQAQSHGDYGFVMILLAAALVILIFAVINYINLSVAQSGFRAKEMATRRLLGSKVGAIFYKFIFESVLICLISFFIAIVLAELVEPVFNDILQTEINIKEEFSLFNIAICGGFVLLLGAVSGVVPAHVITRFKPIDVVKGSFSYRTKKVYSKVLIAFQYCLTIVLIGSTIVIVDQTTFMRSKDLHFKTKDLYAVNWYVSAEKENSIRAELLSQSGIEQVGFALWLPTFGRNNNSFVYNDVQQSFSIFMFDSVCMDMLGFEILSRTDNMADSAMWINETGLRNLGLKTAPHEIKPPEYNGGGYGICGVVRDFHFLGLTREISSAMVAGRKIDTNYSDGSNWVVLKMSNPEAPDRVKPIFAKSTNGSPFEGSWLDEQVMQWSDSARRQGELIGYLSLLAIIISSLGMLAMATYFIQQRAIEIAVRKVFGATKGEVLGQLMWSFLRLVLIGYVVAVPAIWYFCGGWLEGFAYRVNVSVLVYVIAGVVALAVASLTIFWQAYRAMNAPAAMELKK